MRGEYPTEWGYIINDTGSPPLARGVPRGSIEVENKRGITPACAGSTMDRGLVKAFWKDHPRLRGEYTKKSLILRDPCLLV